MITDDLYSKPSTGAEFTRFCGGNQQGGDDQESCVELARIPGTDSDYIVRDTKAAGRELRFTGGELDNFVRGYARERGLTL